jgi:hypothetical protein
VLAGTVVAGTLAWAIVCACVVVLLLGFAHSVVNPLAAGVSQSPTPAPSSAAELDIPPLYLALYMEAATRFGLDWTILAGIGRVECDHGRDPAPSCTVEGQLNNAGAGGPAQFLVSTWNRYGISADGQGLPDMWDPADAIFSMAGYLRASGAPANYWQAVFAYNHAAWYVTDVLSWARRYRGAYTEAQPTLGPVVRAPAAVPWLAALPGTSIHCDARIVADVEYILSTFRLEPTSCYRADGPSDHGEHPLGLALDAVPVDGDWSHALAAAEAFGWRAACAATGCADQLGAPLRFIGYNGYAGHGDPAHAGANAHIHFSWIHAPAAPNTQAAWVEVFEAAGSQGP